MKYLVGLTAILLTQSFSAKAINSLEVQYNSLPVMLRQVACHTIDKNVCSTEKSTPLFRINTLSIKPTPNGILLSWMVEETANLQYFVIEHSKDGQYFLPLFEVPVLLHQKNYSFIDAGFKASEKKGYYRVKAVCPTVVIESPIQKL
jgi:hypothetical protein